MSLRSVWRYLAHGSDEQRMPRTWLEGPRVRQYTAYTMRQLQQGSVVKDVAAKRREAFWAALEAKQAQRKLKVVSGRFQ